PLTAATYPARSRPSARGPGAPDYPANVSTLVGETLVALDAVTTSLPRGEARAGQRHMAEAVAAGIEGGRHVIVQAGTGTGKTLAYLVPAVLSGRKVVVATATLALQDQLVRQ